MPEPAVGVVGQSAVAVQRDFRARRQDEGLADAYRLPIDLDGDGKGRSRKTPGQRDHGGICLTRVYCEVAPGTDVSHRLPAATAVSDPLYRAPPGEGRV